MALKKTLNFLILFYFLLVPSLAFAGDSEPLDKKDQEMAGEMSDLYAHHLFNDYCLKTFGFYLSDKGTYLIPMDPELSKKLTSSCQCMSDFVSSNASSNDIIRYVMSRNGGTVSFKTPAEADAYLMKNRFVGVHSAIFNVEARKKCGFSR